MSTIAKEFFEKITKAPDPIAIFKAMIDPDRPRTEEEWLEFKGPQIQERDRDKHWSEMLSAFANTGGGVVVWGIEAKKNRATKKDGVIAIDGLSDAAVVEYRLREIQLQATDPPVTGIEYAHIAHPDKPGKGFIVCHVPESRHRPHRAEFATNKPNMMRAGANSVVMAQSVLRAMFYPQTRPILSVVAGVTYENGTTVLDVTLKNTGNATARDIIVTMRTNRVSGDWRPSAGWEHMVLPGKTVKYSYPLHQGGETKLFRAYEKIASPEFLDLSFNYWLEVFANDTERALFDLEFTRQDIEQQKFRDFFPAERD